MLSVHFTAQWKLTAIAGIRFRVWQAVTIGDKTKLDGAKSEKNNLFFLVDMESGQSAVTDSGGAEIKCTTEMHPPYPQQIKFKFRKNAKAICVWESEKAKLNLWEGSMAYSLTFQLEQQ